MRKAFLTDPIHPVQLKAAIGEVEAAVERFYTKAETYPVEHIAGELEEIAKRVGLQAAMAGREYASEMTTGMTKLGWVPTEFSWEDDAKRIISHLKINPSRYLLNKIHHSLMTGEGPPVEELARNLGYEQGKAIARTVVMNIYSKAALKKWEEDGIQHVKRLAMEDNKTCPICRALNGREYLVADLLLLPNPQSADTHENCRCTFISVVNISTYAPRRRALPKLSVTTKHNTAENVPIELYSMLKSIMHGGALPFNVRFDNKMKADYRRQGNDLVINPKALVDEDLRELIYEEQAEELWPGVEQRVIDEYLPLLQQGFAKTSRSWTTPKEAFVNNWVAFRLGQSPFDQDIWGQAFMRSVARDAAAT